MSWDGGWYPPSRPRKPKRGIQAKTKRGAFGASWWARRWISALESFGWSNRLQRGRSYARGGQVTSINVKVGEVTARVQGSRSAPYSVWINLAPLSDHQWDKAIDAMAEQALLAAQLLAGEMPRDIEEAFTRAGVPLFPHRAGDLLTHCTCPDFANPCKHIAAVYYLLGERFDEDPFVLFALRGRSRDQIMQALRDRRVTASAGGGPEPQAPAEVVQPLAEQLENYYLAGPDLESIQPRVTPPSVKLPVLTRLGPPPHGSGSDLAELYKRMTSEAIKRVLGD